MSRSDTKNSEQVSGKTRFISQRWRSLLPLSVVVTIAAMIGAYVLASSLSGGIKISEANVSIQSTVSVIERSIDLYSRYRTEAQRISFTIGVPEAIRARQGTSLHTILEGMASAAGLDSIIVTDANGVEVVGLLRTETPEFTDYAVSFETPLGDQRLIRSVLDGESAGTTELLRTQAGLLLYTAVPVNFDGELVGVALVGQQIDETLELLQSSAVADVVLYGADGTLLQTTFPLTDASISAFVLDSANVNQALASVQQIIGPAALQIEGSPYLLTYAPFNFGPNTLGIIGTLIPDNVPFATEVGRQVTALLLSAITGIVVITVFVSVSRMMSRVEAVTAVAQTLQAGEFYARTGMQASDEIGAMGQALDQYADSVQARHDKLRDMLRRQRREAYALLAVLESIPDGIIVQDLEGRVILMNEQSRLLLGSQRVFRSAGIHELARVVGETLGPALAPGLYALGDPQRIDLDNKLLSAQAAAVLSMTGQRLGTVILVRDISEKVREETAREQMLARLAQDIQQPLAGLAQTGTRSPNTLVNAFAREISRYSAALQMMIVEMRELNQYDQDDARQMQRPLRLESLLWAVANDWRQIAQAAGLTLHVIIEQKGLYVLGDERRLRWAVGNIIDNAIKYTLPGGALTLEIKGEENDMALLRIRDNGVGISKEDLNHVFVRFYRGTPTSKENEVVRVPGMGQGLTTARQIVEAHGGTIRIKSKVQVGTAVYIALPQTAGVAYELPYLDEAIMEGETMPLPKDVDLDAFWQQPRRD